MFRVENGIPILMQLNFARYLRDLQNQARGRASENSPHSVGPSNDASEKADRTPCVSEQLPLLDHTESPPSSISQGSDSALNIWASPFTLPSSVIKDAGTTKRNWCKYTTACFPFQVDVNQYGWHRHPLGLLLQDLLS